jgi:hypothetical protein
MEFTRPYLRRAAVERHVAGTDALDPVTPLNQPERRGKPLTGQMPVCLIGNAVGDALKDRVGKLVGNPAAK